jgi:hypothetical protein
MRARWVFQADHRYPDVDVGKCGAGSAANEFDLPGRAIMRKANARRPDEKNG